MKITNETIKFKVTYKSLNCFVNNIVYSLYVAFEYNGICTITPGFCGLAMVHVNSFKQITNAERTSGYKISRICGKDLWDKTKRFLNKDNNFAKRSKIVTKTLRTIGNPITNRITDVTDMWVMATVLVLLE